MAIEVEKKYRLRREERPAMVERLLEAGAVREGEEFEENTIYAGGGLDPQRSVLRVRRVGERAILTYKERFPTSSAIKRQREEETEVASAEAIQAILAALGYRPALVYEKRRETWQIGGAEVVIDELPFGLFAEIEGEEAAIRDLEERLSLASAEAEMATYPHLTQQHGERKGSTIEARFEKR